MPFHLRAAVNTNNYVATAERWRQYYVGVFSSHSLDTPRIIKFASGHSVPAYITFVVKVNDNFHIEIYIFLQTNWNSTIWTTVKTSYFVNVSKSFQVPSSAVSEIAAVSDLIRNNLMNVTIRVNNFVCSLMIC